MLHDLVEQPEGSAVDVFAANSMIALLQEKLSNRCCCRHSRGEGISGHPSLQHSHVLFQGHTRRVLGACVLETFVSAQALLDVGGCLVDRNSDCAGCGIRFLAGMNSVCSKTHTKRMATKKHKRHKIFVPLVPFCGR